MEAGLIAAVCGEDMEGDWNTLKGPSKRKIPWWWNDEIGKAVKGKGIANRSWKKAKQGLDRKLEDDLKASYCRGGEREGKRFQSSQEDGEGQKDVVGCGAVKDSNGCLVAASARV